MSEFNFESDRALRAWCLEPGIKDSFGIGLDDVLETAKRYYEFITKARRMDREDGAFQELKRLFDGEVERIKTTLFVASFACSVTEGDGQAYAKAATLARLLDGETVGQGESVLERALRLVRVTHKIDDAVFRSRLGCSKQLTI